MKKEFINNFSIALFLLLTIHGPTFAKKSFHKPHWEQVIPEIGKEFLPEETREKIEKVFPSPK